MKIVIDPGHGGSDPGAIGPAGTQEKTHTLAVALYLRTLLQEAGHQVILTRETDRDVAYPDASASEELQARVDIANQAGAGLFISLHANAADNSGAGGTETWYYLDGYLLAEAVQGELANLGLTDRGVKQANFYVLKYTEMPAILVELAFISNSAEERLLAAEEFRERAAREINNGLAVWQQT
ncbi:MAG: N-acetylmuramoyl-L-alanine amidase [Bacillota bacterium]|nr:N-acetylmuramoyl-L-alanine amidase [Bacillota bacterium]HWR57047.1 N-acetylmuramoyl-L-alanine amidase [Negativicutes bacterium]